ncbi:hypothetical protein KY345_06730 [Candidatus Woesearchaeota archaeon]|nr:hypothetical protein [Candidatus Woesearchaeota archaeon]
MSNIFKTLALCAGISLGSYTAVSAQYTAPDYAPEVKVTASQDLDKILKKRKVQERYSEHGKPKIDFSLLLKEGDKPMIDESGITLSPYYNRPSDLQDTVYNALVRYSQLLDSLGPDVKKQKFAEGRLRSVLKKELIRDLREECGNPDIRIKEIDETEEGYVDVFPDFKTIWVDPDCSEERMYDLVSRALIVYDELVNSDNPEEKAYEIARGYLDNTLKNPMTGILMSKRKDLKIEIEEHMHGEFCCAGKVRGDTMTLDFRFLTQSDLQEAFYKCLRKLDGPAEKPSVMDTWLNKKEEPKPGYEKKAEEEGPGPSIMDTFLKK